MENPKYLSSGQHEKSKHARSKYLVFKLGIERFGVALSSVKEVLIST